jgi:two-component system osmolarity sensor histidine kinase EnvZ
MRERIERQIEQRTMMLSGVSHDLRTILTRFRLQLAIADSPKDLEGMNRDVDDMNTMLDGYLDFARGQTEERQGELDLYQLFSQLEESAALHGKTLTSSIDGQNKVIVRPTAFTRLLTNLTANAWRHAENIRIEAKNSRRFLTITVDDDGPGIPEAMREEVFKPFYRLDEARNLDATGTGLGLAIVRDIARGHGGNVTLSDSPMGGLRATVRIPV